MTNESNDCLPGKLDRLPGHFQSGSWMAELLAKLDSDEKAVPGTHADMLAEQLCQRLLKALPSSSSVARAGPSRTLATVVGTFAKHDRLDLTKKLVEQFQTLGKAFFCLSPDSNGETVFAKESLEAIEAIEAADAGSSLLMAVASLPQSANLLTELKSIYKKARSNTKHLEEFLVRQFISAFRFGPGSVSFFPGPGGSNHLDRRYLDSIVQPSHL